MFSRIRQRKDLNQSRCRRFGFETLSERLVLSANPVALTDAPAGEGESHIIQQVQEVVFVFGGDDADSIRVEMGTTEHSLIVNGESHKYDASVVDEIVVSGMGGADDIQIVGSEIGDHVEIRSDELEMLNGRYKVRVQKIEDVLIDAGGGDDTAKIYDSTGDDKLSMFTTHSEYEAGNGDKYRIAVEQVEAFAENGGQDAVTFYDSAADDRFVAKTEFAYMIGGGFWNFAKGFQRIEAFQQNGGQDEARFYDSAGDDHLVARPDEVTFTAGGTTMIVHDFHTTRTIASDGNDTAELYGQEHLQDRFVWQDNSSYMYTTGIDDPGVVASELPDYKNVTASNLVVGFDRVEALGGGPEDRAELRGSAGDDNLIALPEIVQLTTPTAEVEAADFRIVRSHGRGGTDRAHLQDSPANDNYVSNDRFAYLEGTDYLNYVAGFSIDVFAPDTGDDYAHAQDYTGPNKDYLVFDDDQFLIWGPDREERIHGFSRARGDGAGPAGFQVISQITHAFILGGSHDQNDVPPEDVSTALVARSDEAITLYAIVDGDIVAT